MIAKPRNTPRYVPTLTEIVDPTGLTSVPATSLPTVQEQVASEVDAMVSRVLDQWRPEFERRFQQALESTLKDFMAAHSKSVSSQLQKELDAVVRQAASDALTRSEPTNLTG